LPSINTLSVPHRLWRKLKFVWGPKCLNGIKELNIESDGRGIFCQMGSPWSAALTESNVRDFNFDLEKFFNSKESRSKRLNCQGCKLSCQQHIYFQPKADNLPAIVFRILWLPFRLFFKSITGGSRIRHPSTR
jgi:hypothetical protein